MNRKSGVWFWKQGTSYYAERERETDQKYSLSSGNTLLILKIHWPQLLGTSKSKARIGSLERMRMRKPVIFWINLEKTCFISCHQEINGFSHSACFKRWDGISLMNLKCAFPSKLFRFPVLPGVWLSIGHPSPTQGSGHKAWFLRLPDKQGIGDLSNTVKFLWITQGMPV